MPRPDSGRVKRGEGTGGDWREGDAMVDCTLPLIGHMSALKYLKTGTRNGHPKKKIDSTKLS